MAAAPLTVRRITADEHLAYVRAHEDSGRISFLQVPSWAGVKAEWQHAPLGWFDGDRIVGAGLVLLRQVPRLKRYLAYLPEGPDIDWTGEREGRPLWEWLDPLAATLKAMGAFQVKMGPMAAVRRWHAETLKAAIAEDERQARQVLASPTIRERNAKVIGTLGGIEMGLRAAGIPHKAGGAQAAIDYLSGNA